MLKTLNALNSLLASILALAILALLGIGVWIGLKNYYGGKWTLEETQEKLADREARVKVLTEQLQTRRAELRQVGEELKTSQKQASRLGQEVQRQTAQIATLQKDLEDKQKEIQRLAAVVKLLKLDHRIAQITVLSQTRSADGKDVSTTFTFAEVNDEGKPLDKPRTFTIKGDVVYLDAWVVKFDFDYLEKGDPLRATSICLFRRIFGESQRPADGFALDPVGAQPAAYRTGGKPSEFEQQIWSRFWEYANDPSLAKQAGVRAAHGEAPSIKLLAGKRYRVLLQAAGGLRIDPPEDVPSARVE